MTRKGITLVLVLLILTALIMLGIPFAISMLYKEKTSKDTLHITQSRIAASGARNSAINLLLRTHDFYELQPYPAPFNDPDCDTLREMSLDLSQLNITDTSNSKGIIWSSYAEDEQGKINILTAPRRVVDYLKTLIKPNEDIQHFITEYSYRSTPWIGAQNLAGYRRYLASDGNTYDIIYVDNPVPCGNEEGLRVRLHQGDQEVIAYVAKEPCPLCPIAGRPAMQETPDKVNGTTGYHNAWVTAYDTPPIIWRNFGASEAIWLDRTITNSFLTETTTVEIEQPHPVNINTASKEVLLALFTGVGSNDAITNTTVTQAEAQTLVDEITKAPLIGPPDLEQVISNTLSSDQRGQMQKWQLWLNSFYPRDATTYLANIVERHYTGTMPFCYRSYDIYTLNSTGIVNYPSGNQASVTTINEVVDIAPVSDVITWSIESQYDFDKEFYTYLGNPFKMTTYPYLTKLGIRDDSQANLNPDYSRDPDIGALKLRTAIDNRRINPLGTTSSFSDTYDGQKIPLPPPEPAGLRYPTASTVQTTTLDIQPGGVEFWIKFDSIPGLANLFDIKQQDYENRLALWYNNGQLVLSVCDATKEEKAAQIRAPVTFEPEVWYHIGAFWEGTKYAQMALFLDGRPIGSFGHYDNSSPQPILTQLTANISDVSGMDNSQNEMTINVGSTDGFPSAGVIEIGIEAIDYISKTGNGFIVQTIWNPMSPTQLALTGRGSRWTPIISHTAGAKVTIYGYSNPFIDNFLIAISLTPFILPGNPLCMGGATLIDTIPITSPGNIVIDKPGSQIGANDTSIPITSTFVTMTITGLPSKGYVRIDNEVIYYDSYVTSTSTLENCQRGAENTTASVHSGGPITPTPSNPPAAVQVFSIQVSDTTNYNSPAIIQIDDEWFGPLQKAITNTNFFVGPIANGAPSILARGWVSSPTTHSPDTPIIPVFFAQHPYTGKNDTVTIIESNQANPKEEKTVRNAVNKNRAPVFLFSGSIPDGYSATRTPPSLFAFSDNLSRNYTVDGMVTRLLKFPSDELPSYFPATSFTIGSNLSATIDEVKFFSDAKDNRVITETLLASDSGKTTVTLSDTLSANSGLIKIGDEYIGFASTSTSTLTACVRGYLNTPIQTHDYGQRIFNLSRFLPVTALSQGIFPENFRIPIKSSGGFASNGYVLIGDNFNTGEVAGYLQTSGGFLRMPEHSNGIFRGMFGTSPQNHQTNTLCYAIPFRYWHLEKANAFDSQMAYFQAAHLARGATWKRITWDEEHIPSNDNLIRLRFLVRFDNQPAWNTTPNNQPGGIFEFTNPTDPNELNVKADQVEVMVFFQYLPGALTGNAWKRSPLLKDIHVTYAKPIITLSKQER
ncbi:MAG: hypothetical protein HZA49_11285 [Planctomycetes bacterium]|nr:hypothetical protein [Planctomycetota bacterium]